MTRGPNEPSASGPYIIDACTIIDYQKSEDFVLGLFAEHFGPVYVAEPVLDAEIKGFSLEDCERLGLRVARPALSQLIEAVQRRQRISEFDACNLILARDNDWTLITSDKALCKAATVENVRYVRGLRPMILLVRSGHLPAKMALTISEKMRTVNPSYITDQILDEFRREIGLLKTRPGRKV
jgi:predicted nucleic acid-binding protein